MNDQLICAVCGQGRDAAAHVTENESAHAFVEKPEVRWFALVDESKGAKIPGQLTGFEQRECLAADHVRSPGKFPVPPNCDLAVMRYRLWKKPNGRETFLPIHHANDAGAENMAMPESPQVLVARAVLELAATGALGADTNKAITDYLNSFDAGGA
jgi:hypothetical protein